MFGHYQQTCLRIELHPPASSEPLTSKIAASLQEPDQFRRWLFPQQFEAKIVSPLIAGATFSAWTGPVKIDHYVELATPESLRLILSGGIDGFHEWYWGEDWVQSRIEGISLLPLHLGQTFALMRLRQFLNEQAS